MKKLSLILLGVPLFLMSGLGYVLIANKLVRDREPWFTLCLVCGLATTVALLAWCTGTTLVIGLGVFAGAVFLYLGMCLLFGKDSRIEMLVPAHVLAILSMMAIPVYTSVRKKALRTTAAVSSHYQTMTSSSFSSTAAGGAGLTKS